MGRADRALAFERRGGTLPDDFREHIHALHDDWAVRARARGAPSLPEVVERSPVAAIPAFAPGGKK